MQDLEARRAIQQQANEMNKLAKAIQEAAIKQQEAALAAQQEKIKNTLIEVQAKIYDKAVAYTNLVLVGGYAGSFTIWSATKAQLSTKANIAVALIPRH